MLFEKIALKYIHVFHNNEILTLIYYIFEFKTKKKYLSNYSSTTSEILIFKRFQFIN